MASTPNVTYSPVDALAQLTSSSSITVPTAIYTGPSSGQSTGGAKIGVFRAINTDTAKSFNLNIYKTVSGVDYLLGVIALGAAASATSPTVVDILSQIWGGPMNLGPSTILKAMPDVAPTSGAVINLHIEAATF